MILASCCSVDLKENYQKSNSYGFDPCKGIELIKSTATYSNGKVNHDVTVYGTGFVTDSTDNKFYMLSAGHVVDFPEELYGFKLKDVSYSLTDGTKLEMIVSNYSYIMDYSLLTGKGKREEAAVIGDSSLIKKGTKVFVCGYPLTVTKNYTEGIVTSENIDAPVLPELKTDSVFMFSTPISPGNSGSPVCAVSYGKPYVVGIAVANFTRGQSLNLAVKINEVMKDIKNKLKQEEQNEKEED